MAMATHARTHTLGTDCSGDDAGSRQILQYLFAKNFALQLRGTAVSDSH